MFFIDAVLFTLQDSYILALMDNCFFNGCIVFHSSIIYLTISPLMYFSQHLAISNHVAINILVQIFLLAFLSPPPEPLIL